MLFNSIVVDMLVILIEHAKIDCRIEKVVPHIVKLSILEYADDIFRKTEKYEINIIEFRATFRT
jgi:hypothetical protein